LKKIVDFTGFCAKCTENLYEQKAFAIRVVQMVAEPWKTPACRGGISRYFPRRHREKCGARYPIAAFNPEGMIRK
jgi:RNase P subunit RPR2